jgi:hypothetical protein
MAVNYPEKFPNSDPSFHPPTLDIYVCYVLSTYLPYLNTSKVRILPTTYLPTYIRVFYHLSPISHIALDHYACTYVHTYVGTCTTRVSNGAREQQWFRPSSFRFLDIHGFDSQSRLLRQLEWRTMGLCAARKLSKKSDSVAAKVTRCAFEKNRPKCGPTRFFYYFEAFVKQWQCSGAAVARRLSDGIRK